MNFSLKGIPVLDSFVARDAEMDRLAEILLYNSAYKTRGKVCVLHGLGGIGKTQLAAEFARKYQNNYSAVFWIDGSSKEKLKQRIANLANQLPQHQLMERARSYAQQPHQELDGAVEDVLLWFSQPLNNKWLLIFDNVNRAYSAEPEDPEAFDIKEYLPEADQGSVLITSRLAGVWRFVGSDIKLDPIDALQGEHLLNLIMEKPLAGRFNQKDILQGTVVLTGSGRFTRARGNASRSSISYLSGRFVHA